MKNQNYLIVISGFSGTGKTTISKNLSLFFPGILLSVDEIEKHLLSQSIKNAEHFKYPYTLMLTKHLLKKNNVILDGNFKSTETRKKIFEIVKITYSKYYLIHCDCKKNIAEKRIKHRNLLQPGFYKKTASYSYSRNLFEPINEHPYLKLNTDQAIEKNIKKIIEYIQN